MGLEYKHGQWHHSESDQTELIYIKKTEGLVRSLSDLLRVGPYENHYLKVYCHLRVYRDNTKNNLKIQRELCGTKL